MLDELTADKLAIRETVENWVVWRDAGDWERFATVWHADGWMTATWFQGPYADFIKISKKSFDAGVNILHQLGGWSCDIAGDRAISQTKMTILQRGRSTGCRWTWCAGVASTTSSRSGTAAGASSAANRSTRRIAWTRWIRQRRCRSTPSLLAKFPEGYRHLAYLQAKVGFKVKEALPGLKGPAGGEALRRGQGLAGRRVDARRAALGDRWTAC